MIEHLYLVVERAKRSWRGVRISKTSKKRPRLARPTEQALVKLSVNIPDTIMEPREIAVQIGREHLVQPTVVVTPLKP